MGDVMDRRTFLAAAAGTAAALTFPQGAAVADDLPLGPLPGTRYPDPRVQALDPRFKYKIGNAGIERVATGFRWCEGPVYVRDGGYLLWSDIPNNRIMRWSEDDGHVSVFRQPSNNSNGNTRDREGRLISCEHDSRRVTRTEHDGSVTVLIDKFNGKPLNAPNDVVVSADGAIWFTDPFFGNLGNYERATKIVASSPDGADARRGAIGVLQSGLYVDPGDTQRRRQPEENRRHDAHQEREGEGSQADADVVDSWYALRAKEPHHAQRQEGQSDAQRSAADGKQYALRQ